MAVRNAHRPLLGGLFGCAAVFVQNLFLAAQPFRPVELARRQALVVRFQLVSHLDAAVRMGPLAESAEEVEQVG